MFSKLMGLGNPFGKKYEPLVKDMDAYYKQSKEEDDELLECNEAIRKVEHSKFYIDQLTPFEKQCFLPKGITSYYNNGMKHDGERTMDYYFILTMDNKQLVKWTLKSGMNCNPYVGRLAFHIRDNSNKIKLAKIIHAMNDYGMMKYTKKQSYDVSKELDEMDRKLNETDDKLREILK